MRERVQSVASAELKSPFERERGREGGGKKEDGRKKKRGGIASSSKVKARGLRAILKHSICSSLSRSLSFSLLHQPSARRLCLPPSTEFHSASSVRLCSSFRFCSAGTCPSRSSVKRRLLGIRPPVWNSR